MINANCQGLSRPIVASRECEAEPCSADCWGFQLLWLSSRLPHTACVTRASSTKPLHSVLTSHSSSLWTLELPAPCWREGGSLCRASLCFSWSPVSISSPPQSLLPGRPCTALCYPSETLMCTPLTLPQPLLTPWSPHCPCPPSLLPAHAPSPSAPSPALHPTLHPPCHLHRNDTLQPLHDALHTPGYLWCPLGAPAAPDTPCPSPHTFGTPLFAPVVQLPVPIPARAPSAAAPHPHAIPGGAGPAQPGALRALGALGVSITLLLLRSPGGCPRRGACPRRTNTGWEYWV